MKTEYILYQWQGNKLLEECIIAYPYQASGQLNYPLVNGEDLLPECDCISIRRVKTNANGDRRCAIIETLYK